LSPIVRTAFAIASLRRARMGTIGGIFPNLPAAQYHRDILAERFGPQIVHIPVAQFKAYLSRAQSEAGATEAAVAALREMGMC